MTTKQCPTPTGSHTFRGGACTTCGAAKPVAARPDLRGAGHMKKGGARATRAHNETERAASRVEVIPTDHVPNREAGARMRAGRPLATDRVAWLGLLAGLSALVGELAHVVLS